ncbi:MAG: hybrid sensor histidine kinase/response regulator [Thermodesulfobacteriota bacterium]|nr:hybrid sensor histidine kinase/response regulator [Thermodesulfobacteriota bacterium]
MKNQNKDNEREKILIVDDTADNIEILVSMLKEKYILSVAKQGRMALEMVLDHKPDLILLDIMMPEMDGYEVCKKLKADETTCDIPIIFVTALDSDTDEKYGFSLGAADYITKPFNPEIVKARIKTHLHLKKHREHLEDMVKDRTLQLQKANTRLKKSDQEKIIFLRYLSHEMNTPLNWIGVASIIDKSDLNKENKEFLNIIEKGFERISSLVTEVISYFDFAGNALNLDIRNVSIRDTVLNIIKSHKDTTCDRVNEETFAHAKDIDIRHELSNDLVIQADPEYFKELLNILMDNAVVFSETGGTVMVESRINKKIPELIFTDQGKGIDKKNLDALFTPFALESHERHEYGKEGYGLNLPRAKIIADAHGWGLWAKSKGKGQGAEFIIEFGHPS